MRVTAHAETSSSDGGGLSSGAIGGIVAGAVVGTVLIALLALLVARKLLKRRQAALPNELPKGDPSSPSTKMLAAQLASDPTWPNSNTHLAFEVASDEKGPSTQSSQDTQVISS